MVEALDKSLHLIILSSEQCNFRCTYCYETFERGNLKREVEDNIISLIKHRLPNLDHLHIGWFGGEPLLNFKAISRVGSQIKDANINGAKVTGSISTNGALLTAERARSLFELGVQTFQISIDGSRPHHNATRLTRKGQGSYEDVMSAIRALKESKYDNDVRLRLHVTRNNYGDYHHLFDDLAVMLGNDPRFHLHIKAVEPLGSKNDADFGFVEDDQSLSGLEELAQQFGLSITADEGGVCYAAMPNSFVIRTDGSLLKCTVALDDERNIIGKIASGGVEVDNEKHFPWIQSFFENNEKGMSCPAGNVLSY